MEKWQKQKKKKILLFGISRTNFESQVFSEPNFLILKRKYYYLLHKLVEKFERITCKVTSMDGFLV